MIKQIISALLCAAIFMPAAQAMLVGRNPVTQTSSFRRADVDNKVAERRDIGARPASFRQAAPATRQTAFRNANVTNKGVQRPALRNATATKTAVQRPAFRNANVANTSVQRPALNGQSAAAFRQAPQAGLNRQGMVRPADRMNRLQTAPVASAPLATTAAANKFSLASAQSGFSSVSSAPGFSNLVPAAGSSQISEGLSSASTFQDLGQTTGSTAPGAVQNVMQSAPAQRATTFFQ